MTPWHCAGCFVTHHEPAHHPVQVRKDRPMTYKQARALLRDAVSAVDEKLCARAGREERP